MSKIISALVRECGRRVSRGPWLYGLFIFIRFFCRELNNAGYKLRINIWRNVDEKSENRR